MKTLKVVLIAGIILSLMAGISLSIAYASDRSERLSQESSYTFSPGYINAARYQADSFSRINIPQDKKKGFFENAIDFVKDELGRRTEEQAPAKEITKPKLQQKTGATNRPKLAAVATNRIVDSTQLNLKIGDGIEGTQEYENGRLMAEQFMINDVATRCVYAGFDAVGDAILVDAYNRANDGNIIIVRGNKSYDGILISDNAGSGTPYSPSKEVKIYGGYDETGVRDINSTPSTITDRVMVGSNAKSVEINGFNFYYSSVNLDNASNVTVANCTFGGEFYANYGIDIASSQGIMINNNTFNNIYSMRILGSSLGQEGIPPSRSFVEVGIRSIVTTKDNNFKAAIGWDDANAFWLGNIVEITSQGDYFTTGESTWQGVDPGYLGQIDLGGITVIDSRAQSNAGYYNPLSTPQGTFITTLTNNYPLAQDYYALDSNLFSNSYYRDIKYLNYEESAFILKGLLDNKNNLMPNGGMTGEPDMTLIAKIARDALGKGDFVVTDKTTQEHVIEVAKTLGAILANPTDDQKAVIDVMSSLLTEMDNVEGKAGANPELKKASDELLQAVANVLLAQAIPDLLKEGDLSNIKGIFSNLDSAKTKVILEYNESTKPYYDEVKKILQRNAEALQLSNLLQKNILQKEMEELPRSEIDKIIDKLKSKEKKTTEEEYILQQAAKYKEKYVDPNKKKLEEDMKVTLQDFTKKLSATIETNKR